MCGVNALCKTDVNCGSHPIKKIIKPWHDGLPHQGLAMVWRGSAVLIKMPAGSDPLRERLSGAAGFIGRDQVVSFASV
jgi:hypothetical protein